MKRPHRRHKSHGLVVVSRELRDGFNDLQNELSLFGNEPARTSSAYSRIAWVMSARPDRYCFACFSGSLVMPRTSCSTCICPSHSTPAPIPMVGYETASVICL